MIEKGDNFIKRKFENDIYNIFFYMPQIYQEMSDSSGDSIAGILFSPEILFLKHQECWNFDNTRQKCQSKWEEGE